MDFLLILIVAGVLIWLLQRVDTLEKRLARLEAERPAAPVVQPEAPTALPPAARVPLVRAKAPRHETVTAAEPVERVRGALRWPKPAFDFEEIFGRLLPIWAGGITLAVAGFFLVRWSIEAGLLTPAVRVALGFAFGLALVAGAEAAYRFESRIADVRVRQALAGAGLATLYASFYLAGSLYGLVGTTVSFLGLAGVTAAAIALSFRFGLPSAVLGLVGGFAAPTLVGGEQANVPLLALYLALVTAGLSLTGQRQDRAWLGLAALGGGLGWGVLLLLSGMSGTAESVALGVYLVALGAVVPALAGRGRFEGIARIVAAGLATLQMAALIDQGEYGPLAWFLYFLLTAALAFFGWSYARMREASAIAAATALWLLAIWPEPDPATYAIVAAALAATLAGAPLLHVWRGAARGVDFGQVCGFPLALIGVTWLHFGDPGAAIEPVLALAALCLSALPALAAWRSWPKDERPLERGNVAAVASAALGLFAAGLLATPDWLAPLIAAAVTVGVPFLKRDRSLANLGWAGSVIALLALAVTPNFAAETLHLAGSGPDAAEWRGALRWLAAGVPFALLAIREARVAWRRVGEGGAALLAYGAAAQVLPWESLPAAAALAAVPLAWRWPTRVAAQAAFLAVALLWAAEPLLAWCEAGIEALFGMPMLLPDVPPVRTVVVQLLPVALGAAAVLHLARPFPPARRQWAWGAVAALGTVAAHVFYKQLFGIASPTEFAALGLAERTAWEALLLGAALLAWRFGGRLVATLPAGAALAHFAWFTVLLHDPLWAEQLVGPLPVANLLLPAYAVGLGAVLFLRREWAGASRHVAPALDAAAMLLVTLFALSELRHAFAGSLLTATPVGQTEDLLRSLLGIVLALAFLLWGARTGARSWRIGSLVLILLAVLKVFLFDAAGLEGLARIASFMALGFSLIGIGWFYTRQLGRAGPKAV